MTDEQYQAERSAIWEQVARELSDDYSMNYDEL